VAQAETLCEIFNRPGHGCPGRADWICGTTSKEKRADVLEKFQKGGIQIVVNCGCLTEGFDNPGVEVVIMARPTKSRALFAQMVGRATRTLPFVIDGINDPAGRIAAIAASSKPVCTVVDFVGNTARHDLITCADILGGKYSDDVIEAVKREAEKSDKPVDMAKALREMQEKVEAARKEREARERMAAEARHLIVGKAKFYVTPMQAFKKLGIPPPSMRGWNRGRKLSEKQRGVLERQHIDPDSVEYDTGKALIDGLFQSWNKPCTEKQNASLKKRGYDADGITKSEAGKIMGALASNNWNRLEGQFSVQSMNEKVARRKQKENSEPTTIETPPPETTHAPIVAHYEETENFRFEDLPVTK
jgi:superfamily II DNA/RNA helicase